MSSIHLTRSIVIETKIYRTTFHHCFSDGASGHFKNNASILNLVHHKADFGMDAWWTFTASGHGKAAGDGIGAVLKSTARRVTLSKNILLSTPKDFYEFSRQQQLEAADASSKAYPSIEVFFLNGKEVEKTKATVLKARSEQIKTSGKAKFFSSNNNDVSVKEQFKVFVLSTNSSHSAATLFNVGQHLVQRKSKDFHFDDVDLKLFLLIPNSKR